MKLNVNMIYYYFTTKKNMVNMKLITRLCLDDQINFTKKKTERFNRKNK